MRLRIWMLPLVLLLSSGVGLAQQKEAPVSPDLVFAERYLEKGWYREAWELLDPMVREGKADNVRILVAAAEAAYGLERIGESMGFIDTIRSQQMTPTPDQATRIDAVEKKVKERCGVLLFQWPDEDDDAAQTVKRTEKFVLEWADVKPLSEQDEEAFRLVFQQLGQGITDGTKVYLPRGRVSVNGIWKEIDDEPAIFKVAKEKPPARQRVASGDGLALAMGYKALPGYTGTSYTNFGWTNAQWDSEGEAQGIGSHRFGLVGAPYLEISATHSLIMQGWREVGAKVFFGLSPGTGIAPTVPAEEQTVDTLPEKAPLVAMGALFRQSFRERKGYLVAGAAGAQGLYTSTLRVAAVGDTQEEGQSCTPAPNLDVVAVDRNAWGVGFLGEVEASKSIAAVAARVGVEVSAGYNLLSPMRASSIDFEDNPDGQQICFEDVDRVIGGWDLRTNVFFRMALW